MAETTIEIGGVQVRVIVTDDGHANAHIDETQEYLEAVSATKKYGCTVPLDGDFVLGTNNPEKRRDKVIVWNGDDDISDLKSWGVEEQDIGHPERHDRGAYVSDIDVIEREPPVKYTDTQQVDVGEYTVDVTADADTNIVTAEVVETDPADAFVQVVTEHLESIGGSAKVVDTTEKGASDHHAAAVPKYDFAGHESIAEYENHPRLRITYISGVRETDVYGFGEKYVGNAMLCYEDLERRDG